MSLTNGIVFLTSFIPVWAIIIDRIRLRGWRLFSLIFSSMVGGSIMFLAFFNDPKWAILGNVVWFLYGMELALFFLVFVHHFGPDRLERALALSMLNVFILSEVHEWPGFLLSDYLRFFDDPFTLMAGRLPVLFRILVNLYAIIAFILAWKMAGLRLNRNLALAFLGSILIPVIFLPFEAFNALHILKRFLLALSWMAIFYLWTDATNSSGIGGKKAEPKE